MLLRVLVASTAIAGLAVFIVAPQPVQAGSCTILSEKAIGLKQSETADRAQKQLKRKINHWAQKNGYKNVRVNKSSLVCTKKGSIAQCTASAKVCS